MRLRTTSKQWNVPGRYGPYGELFSFLLKKEPMVVRERIPVEAAKACALVGSHMMAEEDSWRMDSNSSFSSSSSNENNVGDGALFVIGLHGSCRRNRPLPSRLGCGESGLVLSHSPGHVGHVVSGIA